MKKIVWAVILMAVNGLAMLLFSRFPDVFFPVYRSFSKSWIGFLAGLTGHFPFALWDICAVILVLILISTLVYCLVRKKSLLRWFSAVVLSAACLITVVIGGWMLNHYAPELSEELDLEVTVYSADVLAETTEYYMLKAAEYAAQMERDAEGHLLPYDFDEIAVKAGMSYTGLSGTYPVFTGTTVRVKRLSVIGEYLMYNGIIGMFMPLSGEAGVPGSVPTAVLPFTMAHEAGHRLGLAGEDEANFAAFLACTASEDIRFVYSGCYNAFSYCLSALYRTDPERALALYHKYDEDEGMRLLQTDRADTAEVYRRYDSPLQDISDHINDTYLKTFDEESGIASYGEVTDYLIAWHLSGRDIVTD